MRNILMNVPTFNRAGKIAQEIADWNAELPEADRKRKYQKMALSPYIFYRGTNHIFWADFAGDWRLHRFGSPRTRTWIQGDAHIYNFGAFENYDGEVIYGINDFDDALVADYQYDLWRMATSLVLIMRENSNLTRPEQDAIVDTFAEHYLNAIISWSEDSATEELHFTQDNTYGKLDDFLKKVRKKKSRAKMLGKWTVEENGKRRFAIGNGKLASISDVEKVEILMAMDGYKKTLTGKFHADDSEHFRVKDIARRLNAGTGSLGTDRFYILVEGGEGRYDDRILDIKQQSRPTAFNYLSKPERREYTAGFAHDALRHAEGFRAMAEHPDPYLGWMKLGRNWFSVRERSPFKEAFPTEKLEKAKQYHKMAEQWGLILATEHKRGAQSLYKNEGDFTLEKEVNRLTEGQHDRFRLLVRELAFRYASQVEADWHYFLKENASFLA